MDLLLNFSNFLNESKISEKEKFDQKFDFSDLYNSEFKKLTDNLVKELKTNLVGKLIFFKISSENGKWRNANVKIRKISDVKSIDIKDHGDSNIVFIDEKGNVFNVFNKMYSHIYYDIGIFLDYVRKKFKDKIIDVDFHRVSFKDIIIIEDESHNDRLAILTKENDVFQLPYFSEMKEVIYKISEIDPYGEEDWGD